MKRKNIVYIFGADGAGKTTMAEALQTRLPDAVTVNASRPEAWPDTSWHREIQTRGLDPNTRDPAFHFESMSRCYQMAGNLLARSEVSTVCIDSDLRAKIAAKAIAWYQHPESLSTLYGKLCDITNVKVDADIRQVGLHVTIGGESPADRAQLLMGRIADRGEASVFDPDSPQTAESLLAALDDLEGVLQQRQDPFVRVETNQPYDLGQVAGQLLA